MNDSAEKHKNIVFEIKKIKTLYRCSYQGCSSKFREKGNLLTHNRIHTGERPFRCSYENCNKAFITLGNLKSHFTNHTGDKPFKCEVYGCNKKYNRICRLKIHSRTHQGIKPFKCNFNGCGKSFNEKGNFKTHYRIHTGEKPFICDFKDCGMAFKAHGHLKDHKKRHYNIRPYECHTCLAKFARSSTLKIHMNIHSKDSKFITNDQRNTDNEINENNKISINLSSTTNDKFNVKFMPENEFKAEKVENAIDNINKINNKIKEYDCSKEEKHYNLIENKIENLNSGIKKDDVALNTNHLQLVKKSSSNSTTINNTENSGNIDHIKLLQDLTKNNTLNLERNKNSNISSFTMPNKSRIHMVNSIGNNQDINNFPNQSNNNNMNNNNGMFNSNHQGFNFNSLNTNHQIFYQFKQLQNLRNIASPTSDQARFLNMFYQNLQNFNYEIPINSGQQTPQNIFMNQINAYNPNIFFDATPMSSQSNCNNNQITWPKGNMTPNCINTNLNNAASSVYNSPYFLQPQSTSPTFSEMVNMHTKNFQSYQ